ncbi:MAG: hypothetical protein AB7I18_09515 [Candidatus Berkiella sp.]
MSMYGVCGDFVYNYTNGTFSINQFTAFLPVVTSGNFVTAVGSLFLSRNALSNVACAIETKTGLPFVGEAIALGGLCLIGKGLQYGYDRYKVQTPVQLITAILKDKGLPLLNPEYQKLAKTFEKVIDQKVEQFIESWKKQRPDIFNMMTPEFKKNYEASAKDMAIKELPSLMEKNKDAITAAIAQSQVPTPATRTVAAGGMQEGMFNTPAFNLEQALASILYGINPVAQAAPRPQ